MASTEVDTNMLSGPELERALEALLPTVSKPARYTGGELNSIVKSHDAVSLSVAVAFPDAYEIGMSNLACSIIYNLLNSDDETVAERVYAPWPDMEAAMRAAGVPLFSLETRTPLAFFDMIAFALSFEMSYTNVLNMLDLAGIPVRAADRDVPRPDGNAWPIVIAGGHCTFNPEPMAAFIDVFVIGEAEEVLIELTDLVRASRARTRRDTLHAIAQIPGCYVPRFYEPAYESVDSQQRRLATSEPDDYDTMPRLLSTSPTIADVPRKVVRRLVWDVDSLPYPTRPIIPFIEVVHDRISLEVMRGCTRGCRFCQAGMITRPVREKSPARLRELAAQLVESTGHEDISLVSLSTADYSRVDEVVRGMIADYGGSRIGVSLPSLRADRDCVHLVQEINKVRKTGLTFAPEAGSQRLRDVTNKGVEEQDLLAAADTAFANGWQRIKLYFMVSLPTETDEDVVAIGALATACTAIARKNGVRNPTVTIGVSAFVPKPFTAFQWFGQDSLQQIDRKQKLLKGSLRDRAVAYRPNEAVSAFIEAVLSLGDRRVGDAIEAAWRRGQVFDSWDEYLSLDRWMGAFEDAGIDPAYYANRTKAYDEWLPWDHIDCGVAKAYLRAEDKKARTGIQTRDCHTSGCSFCKACDRAWLETPKAVALAEAASRHGLVLEPLTTADRERLGLQV